MSRLLSRLICLLFLFSLLAPAGARAVETGGLYEAVVPVSGQAASERQQAVAEGFRQVLVKLSGQRSVLATPALQAEVTKATALLGAYQYETALARLPGQQVDPAMTALRLRMTFDARGVMAALSRAGAPVWASGRPSVYLWVGRDTPTGRQIYGPDSAQGVALIDMAGARGLPVVLTAAGQPDTGDAGTLSTGVVDAAVRAGSRVILSASTAGSGGRWRASGLLSIDGATQPVDASGPDEYSALRELVAVAADRLGARYAVAARADNLQSVLLRVTGVESLRMHAQLARWLRSQPLVRDLVTERVATNRIEYRLTVAGDTAGLRDLLSADGRLTGIVVVPGDPVLPVLEAGLRPDPDR